MFDTKELDAQHAQNMKEAGDLLVETLQVWADFKKKKIDQKTLAEKLNIIISKKNRLMAWAQNILKTRYSPDKLTEGEAFVRKTKGAPLPEEFALQDLIGLCEDIDSAINTLLGITVLSKFESAPSTLKKNQNRFAVIFGSSGEINIDWNDIFLRVKSAFSLKLGIPNSNIFSFRYINKDLYDRILPLLQRIIGGDVSELFIFTGLHGSKRGQYFSKGYLSYEDKYKDLGTLFPDADILSLETSCRRSGDDPCIIPAGVPSNITAVFSTEFGKVATTGRGVKTFGSERLPEGSNVPLLFASERTAELTSEALSSLQVPPAGLRWSSLPHLILDSMNAINWQYPYTHEASNNLLAPQPQTGQIIKGTSPPQKTSTTKNTTTSETTTASSSPAPTVSTSNQSKPSYSLFYKDWSSTVAASEKEGDIPNVSKGSDGGAGQNFSGSPEAGGLTPLSAIVPSAAQTSMSQLSADVDINPATYSSVMTGSVPSGNPPVVPSAPGSP